MTAPSEKPQFLILLHQPPAQPASHGPSPEEWAAIIGRFVVWMDGLVAKGMVIGSNRLENEGKVLRGSGGAILTDGPYAEAKEIVGGYVLISADNMEEALAAARACPGLDYQMAIEVRPVKAKGNE